MLRRGVESTAPRGEGTAILPGHADARKRAMRLGATFHRNFTFACVDRPGADTTQSVNLEQAWRGQRDRVPWARCSRPSDGFPVHGRGRLSLRRQSRPLDTDRGQAHHLPHESRTVRPDAADRARHRPRVVCQGRVCCHLDRRAHAPGRPAQPGAGLSLSGPADASGPLLSLGGAVASTRLASRKVLRILFYAEYK